MPEHTARIVTTDPVGERFHLGSLGSLKLVSRDVPPILVSGPLLNPWAEVCRCVAEFMELLINTSGHPLPEVILEWSDDHPHKAMDGGDMNQRIIAYIR